MGVGASAPDGQSHPSTCVPLTARTAGPAFRRPDPPTESVSIGGQHAQTPLQTGVVDTVRSSLGSFLGPGSLPFRSECAPTALPLKRASAQLRVGGVSHRGAATANPLGAVCGEIRIDTPREWTAVHATQRKGVAGGGGVELHTSSCPNCSLLGPPPARRGVDQDERVWVEKPCNCKATRPRSSYHTHSRGPQ